MKNRIECPYGAGEAVLKKEPQTLTYRKEKFAVMAHFYVCEECKEEFTNNETDYITLIQAHNQYREKNSIPFPEEIKAIREKYMLSAAKMSEVLRLGENGYANYEKGEIPTPAIGALIKAASKPINFLDWLSSNSKVNSDKKLAKAKNIAENLMYHKDGTNDLLDLLNNYEDTGNYTGYAVLNTNKIENLLLHFIHSCNKEYNDKLKLMKLFFFTDFVHYKNFGRSVSGLCYHKQQAGPVPLCYDYFFTYFEQQRVIYPKWEKIVHGGARETVNTERQQALTDNIFDDNELFTITLITNAYKNTSTWDMVEKSNEMKLKTSDHLQSHLIGFQENAFEMAYDI